MGTEAGVATAGSAGMAPLGVGSDGSGTPLRVYARRLGVAVSVATAEMATSMAVAHGASAGRTHASGAGMAHGVAAGAAAANDQAMVTRAKDGIRVSKHASSSHPITVQSF